MNKNKEFENLTKNWNIPEIRKEVTPANMRWILRNGAIQNRNQPNFEKVIAFAKDNS